MLKKITNCLRPTVIRRMESTSQQTVSSMSVQELRSEVRRLQRTNQNLLNIIKKRDAVEEKDIARPFYYKDCRKRHILLWISYLGWSFDGFVTQNNTGQTVEEIIWAALSKVRLVEDVRKANYSRCGRTDKGVSAFSQVIAIDVRSIQPYDYSPLTNPELPYCTMLNRVLPDDIKAIAWRPTAEGTSARFDCSKRTYKYSFPKGNLNIEAMQTACQYIEGTHDFRNLCKMDVRNAVTKFVRTIDMVRIDQLDFQSDSSDPAFNMFTLTVQSSGFLYHQIRCMMHILFLVGMGYEKPDIIKELLDVEKNPRKPQYHLAHEIPLNLFHVEYPNDGFEWVVDPNNIRKLQRHFLNSWTLQACKTAMLRNMLREVERLAPEQPLNWNDHCLMHITGTHRPLMSRQTCESLEERVQCFMKKRKLKVVEDELHGTRIVRVPKGKKSNDVETEELESESAEEVELIAKSTMIDLCNTIENVIKKKRTESGDETTNGGSPPRVTRRETTDAVDPIVD